MVEMRALIPNAKPKQGNIVYNIFNIYITHTRRTNNGRNI